MGSYTVQFQITQAITSTMIPYICISHHQAKMKNCLSFLITGKCSASFMSISFSTYNPEANKKFQLFKITMFIAFSLKK